MVALTLHVFLLPKGPSPAEGAGVGAAPVVVPAQQRLVISPCDVASLNILTNVRMLRARLAHRRSWSTPCPSRIINPHHSFSAARRAKDDKNRPTYHNHDKQQQRNPLRSTRRLKFGSNDHSEQRRPHHRAAQTHSRNHHRRHSQPSSPRPRDHSNRHSRFAYRFMLGLPPGLLPTRRSTMRAQILPTLLREMEGDE